jgi:hypothetical protein
MRVVRWVLLAAVSGAVALVAPGPLPATAASDNTATVSPAQAKPGATFSLTGQSPGCPNQPFQLKHIYSNNKGQYVTANANGGISNGAGEFSAAGLTVPADAMRSNIYRPYSEWRYDTVQVSFPACAEGLTAAHLNVLSVRYDERIEVFPAIPRTGESVDVVVSNCVGGVLAPFTWIIDVAGSYFHFSQSSYAGNIYNGTADLSDGRRGSEFHTGPAHPSQPAGTRDAALQVPCAQSEGPQSVADADYLFHLNNTVDITIAPATGPLPTPHYPPAEQTSSGGTSTGTGTSVSGGGVSGAPIANPVNGSPTFVG